MLSKFAQTCIAIGVIGGFGYGATYMADSPIVDKALNALNEKSTQIQEAQKHKELLAQQEQHLNEQRKQEELQAKQEAEKAAQAKLQQDQLIAQQIAAQEAQKIVQQKLAEAELAKQERLKNEQAQQKQAQQNVETAHLPDIVKLHVNDAKQTASQTTDNAINKLLGQTK